MVRGTKILPWRKGNGYLTKLHIRANNFQSWGAFLWCLGLCEASPGLDPTAILLVWWWGFGGGEVQFFFLFSNFKFSISLAETIIWNKGDLREDVGSATTPQPQAILDRRKRNRTRLNAAPVFWSWGCWRTPWFKWGLWHWSLLRSSNKAALCLKSLDLEEGQISSAAWKLKNKACKVVHSASPKPEARSLEQHDSGVQVAFLPRRSTSQIPS